MVTFPFQFDQRYQPGSIPQFGSFGPANISNLLQSSISKLADPMIARLRELEVVNKAAALNRETSDIFKQPAIPSPPGASVPAAGVLGTPGAPFVNPGASKGNAGGSFVLGQGMDPGSSEPTLGGTGTARPSSMLEAGKIGIAGVESGGRADPYSAKGPDVPRRDGTVDNAWGKYQVMGSNVGPWTEKYLGQRMTPQEFAANPEAQERVFEGEFGSYLDQYGNLRDAASKWFSGRPMKEAVASGANDRYTSVPSYISQMEQHIKRAYAGGDPPAPQQAPTASFAPPVAPAPTPAAAAAVASPAAAQVHTDAATGRPIAADDPRINPDIQGRPVMPGGQRQVASLDPSVGTGSIRNPAPEIAPRRVPTQALGPDGQPLPPAQQPAAPLPSGQPPNEQPAPPPPPVVQPPPPPTPPVQPPPPVVQAALPTPPVPASQQVAPPRVAPAATAPPPAGQPAAGVPLPQAPFRAPQQVAPQQQVQAAPRQPAFDQTADRFWDAVARNAQTPEQVAFARSKQLELRDPKVTYTVVDGVLVAHKPDGSAIPVYGHQLKGPPTIKIKEGENERALQYDPKTNRWTPIDGGGPAPGTIPKETREVERQLFNDFESTDAVKKYRELEQGVQGLKAAFTGGSATADLVATIQLFKAIDPNSTVTQNESASVKNAAGVPETLRALFNRGVGEGGQFSPELRAEIFNTAQRLQQGRVKQIEQHAEAYRNRAKAYGLDPERTIAFKPFQFGKADPEDFPDAKRRERAAAQERNTPGSSRENPLDVPNNDAAIRQPTGTVVRVPDGRGGFRIFKVVE